MASYKVEHDKGLIIWYKDKESPVIHREDGPALEYANGDKYWFLNGEMLTSVYSQKDFEQWLKYKAFI